MGQVRIKFFAGLISALTLIAFFIFAGSLKTTFLFDATLFPATGSIILPFLGIPVFFIWISMQTVPGLIFLVVTGLVLVFGFESSAYTLPVISVAGMSLAGYAFNKKFENRIKGIEVDEEKADEDLNLLEAEVKSARKDNFRMKNSLERLSYLKNIIEDYSLTVSEGDILDAIIKDTSELFRDADRVLLYNVNTEKQEMELVRSKKREPSRVVKAKKGDVFDKWVMKKKQPVLAEDARADFRFLAKENRDDEFNSLIVVPLVSEDKPMGVLRVDSTEKNKFAQSDLRFLDIIADLSSVSLRNARLYKRLEELAIHDGLTGLYVHKYFIERVTQEIKRSLRNKMDISLLMLDLDNFKDYNDRYGHSAGDLALKHLASILKESAKPGDIVSRYGGEEFAVLLLDKDKDAAAKTAEDIRKKLNRTPITLRREETKMSLSVGVASCPSERADAEGLLMLADSRLYRAKESGKNRVWSK